jgi:hypothetical protein
MDQASRHGYYPPAAALSTRCQLVDEGSPSAGPELPDVLGRVKGADRMGWTCLLLPLAFHSQLQDPPWAHDYEADRPLDHAAPRLYFEATENGSVGVRDGHLIVRAPDLKGAAFAAVGRTAKSDNVREHEWGDAAAWDGSTPTTVEARMRVVELLDGARLAAMLQASNGWTTWNLEFGRDGLYNTGERVFELDTTAFHAYRLTFRDGAANAFVDDAPLPQSCIRELPHQRNGTTCVGQTRRRFPSPCPSA